MFYVLIKISLESHETTSAVLKKVIQIYIPIICIMRICLCRRASPRPTRQIKASNRVVWIFGKFPTESEQEKRLTTIVFVVLFWLAGSLTKLLNNLLHQNSSCTTLAYNRLEWTCSQHVNDIWELPFCTLPFRLVHRPPFHQGNSLRTVRVHLPWASSVRTFHAHLPSLTFVHLCPLFLFCHCKQISD